MENDYQESLENDETPYQTEATSNKVDKMDDEQQEEPGVGESFDLNKLDSKSSGALSDGLTKAGAAVGDGVIATGEAGAITLEFTWWLVIAIILLLIVVLVATAIFKGAPKEDDSTSGGTKTVICIDPGHPSEEESSSTQSQYDADKASWESSKTGANGGTSGGGVEERVINQQVADLLVSELNSRGYNAVETKTDSEAFMSNRDRGKYCSSQGAKLILKIHNDDSSGFNGMAFWYPDKGVIDSKSSNPGGFNEYPYKRSDDTFNNDIKIKDLLKAAFEEGQSKYSYSYPSTTSSGSKNNNNGFGYTYDIPTSLIEMSSMTQSGINFIKETENQKKIVKAFADAVEDYIPPSTGGASSGSIFNMTYYNQFTTDTDSCPVTGSTMWDFGTRTGCGITSQAMVETFILGTKVTPDDIHFGRNGHPKQGLLFNYGVLNSRISSKGVAYERIWISNTTDAENALKKAEEGIKKGFPSVSHTYPPFAHTYHIMVITGFKSDGNIYINDPNCGPTGAKPYIESTPGTGKARLAEREKFKKAMVGRPFEYPVTK